MLISLAVVPVADDVWISNITDEDVVAFGNPRTTGFGSHLLSLMEAEAHEGMLTFERRNALFIRRGRTDEAVLFLDIAAARGIVTTSAPLVTPDDDVYWVTVGTNRQENFEIGIRNGVWGVPSEHASAIREVKPGDKLIFYGRDVGFALCEVRSSPFNNRSRVWPDDEYPYRISISPPLMRNEAEDFSSIYKHLTDRLGRTYSSAQAAGRAIGGRGGIFRKLNPREVAGLLRGLGW
jgi:hypothetical protein